MKLSFMSLTTRFETRFAMMSIATMRMTTTMTDMKNIVIKIKVIIERKSCVLIDKIINNKSN